MEFQKTEELSGPFEVFFDGGCPLCRREIDMLRRKDVDQQIIFTDIAAPDFDPAPYTLTTLMEQIHGRLPNGQMVSGVEVFRQLYSRIGFQRWVRVSRLPILRHLLKLMYSVFARIRYWTAMKRISKIDHCETDVCHRRPVTQSSQDRDTSAPVGQRMMENVNG